MLPSSGWGRRNSPPSCLGDQSELRRRDASDAMRHVLSFLSRAYRRVYVNRALRPSFGEPGQEPPIPLSICNVAASVT